MSISTLSLYFAPRNSIHESQRQLVNAQTELSTGRHADVSLHLGARTADAISLRDVKDQSTSVIEMAGLASTELEITQNSLTALTNLAHQFSATLIGARNSVNGQEVVKAAAKTAMESLGAILNVTHDGKYIFAGINTDTAPLANYSAVPLSSAKSAVDASFLAEFGMSQNSPAVGTITASQMDIFLNGNFSTLFTPAAWSSTFSTAADQNRTARLDRGYNVEVSTNANEAAFRDFTMALTMVFDSGTGALNQAAFEKVVDKAVTMSSTASVDMGLVQSKLGSSQKVISDFVLQLQDQNAILTKEITALEGVDPYEVSTRINLLTTQLEASYSITARINKLNLMNYL